MQKKKVNTVRGKKAPSVLKFVIVKVNPEDKKMFAAKAKKWADGNISALIREAVEAFKLPRGKRLQIKLYK